MSDKSNNQNGWGEYQRLVLSELKRLDVDLKNNNSKINKDIKSIEDKIDKIKSEDLAYIKSEINLLKFKSTLWGAGAGGSLGLLIAAISKLFG